MHLRLNGLVFAVLTVLVAILGTWSGEADLQRLWLLPLALLLLGLAYEGLTVTRARANVTIDAPAQGILGRPMSLQLLFRHALGRDVDIQVAPAAPEAVEIDTEIRALSVPPGRGGGDRVACNASNASDNNEWPGMQARIGGPLGLAWWSRRFEAGYSFKVMPELLRDAAGRISAVGGGMRAHFNQGAGAEILQLREYRARRSAERHRLEGDSATRPVDQSRLHRGSASRYRHRHRCGTYQRVARRRPGSPRSLHQSRCSLR